MAFIRNALHGHCETAHNLMDANGFKLNVQVRFQPVSTDVMMCMAKLSRVGESLEDMEITCPVDRSRTYHRDLSLGPDQPSFVLWLTALGEVVGYRKRVFTTNLWPPWRYGPFSITKFLPRASAEKIMDRIPIVGRTFACQSFTTQATVGAIRYVHECLLSPLLGGMYLLEMTTTRSNLNTNGYLEQQFEDNRVRGVS